MQLDKLVIGYNSGITLKGDAVCVVIVYGSLAPGEIEDHTTEELRSRLMLPCGEVVARDVPAGESVHEER